MTRVNPEEHARRQPGYQRTNDDYILPNDDREIERLIDLDKACNALCQGQLLFTPTPVKPSKIIDFGCGLGSIARRLARTFPSATTYGVDLTAYPPESGDAELPNLSFVQGDFMKMSGADPRFQFGTVDFVWSRLLVCGLVDWPGYMDRVLRLLKPGCWAQMTDFCEDIYFHADKSNRPEAYLAKDEMGWLKALRAGGKRKDLDMDAGKNIETYMRNAGFVDVQRIEIEIPFYREALEQSPHLEISFDHFVTDTYALWWHMIARLVEGMGFSDEQIEQWQLDSREDLGEEPGKYMSLWITIGRKPE